MTQLYGLSKFLSLPDSSDSGVSSGRSSGGGSGGHTSVRGEKDGVPGTYSIGIGGRSVFTPDRRSGPTQGGTPGSPGSYGFTERDFTQKTQTTYAGEQPDYMEAPDEFRLPDRPDMPTFDRPELEMAPEFEAPETPSTPAFIKPEYDEGEISRLQSKAAAPGIRQLRELHGVVRSAARRGDPQGRQTLKQALKGYSKGLSEVIAGTRATAAKEYEAQYARTYDAATKNWQTQVASTRAQYEGDFKAAENNWQAAVQHVRDKYAGQMESRKAEFQAEVDAVNMVYRSEIEAEKTRYEGELKTTLANYESAWAGYLASGTTETVRTYG